MSNRNILGAYDIDLLEPVSTLGFAGNWATGPRGGKLGPQATEFRPPGFMKHKLEVCRVWERLSVLCDEGDEAQVSLSH